MFSFKREQKILYKPDPEKASTLLLSSLFKDSRHWIVLERVVGNSLVGFLKAPDGSMERITLDIDLERERRIEAMRMDGFTEEEIAEKEGTL